MIPPAQRMKTEPSYGIPEDEAGLLTWEFVETRLPHFKNYWVATVKADGTPHAVPSWAVWVDGVLYFGGGEKTVHLRNLAHNPAVVVHGESGDEVIIFEGSVRMLTQATIDPDLMQRIDAAYVLKYGTPHGIPICQLLPRRVLAWSAFPVTATKWEFPAG